MTDGPLTADDVRQALEEIIKEAAAEESQAPKFIVQGYPSPLPLGDHILENYPSPLARKLNHKLSKKKRA
jgi:hypothetical protein